MISHLGQLLHYTFRIPQFPVIQAIATVNELIIAFMVAILIVFGFSEKDIVGLLGLMMLSCGGFLSLGREFYTRHRVAVVRSLLLFASAGMTAFAVFESALGAVCFVMASGSILCCRDIMAAQLHGSIREQSEQHGTDTAQIFAFVIGFGILFSSMMLYLMGLIADQHLSIAILTLAFVVFMAALKLGHGTPNQSTETKQAVEHNRLDIPASIYAQCLLSFCYNAVSYFGRRLAVPLLVIEAGRRFGFSDSLFSVLGLTVGLLALLGLVSQRVKGTGGMSPRTLMFLHYFIGIVTWLMVGLGLYAVEHFTEAALTWTLMALMVVMLGAEISSKLWSIGFMESIKLEALRYGNACGKQTTDYQHAFLGVFLWMKNLGAGTGFILAYLMYDLGVVGAMMALSLLAGVYGVLAIRMLVGRLWITAEQGA